MRDMGRSAVAEDEYQPSLEVFAEDLLRVLDDDGLGGGLRRRAVFRYGREDGHVVRTGFMTYQ